MMCVSLWEVIMMISIYKQSNSKQVSLFVCLVSRVRGGGVQHNEQQCARAYNGTRLFDD